MTVPQVWRHAGAEAAVAALLAHARVRSTGEAQFVDVSAQCAMTWEDGVVDPSWADDDWRSYDRRSQFGGEIAFTPDEVYDALRRVAAPLRSSLARA